MVSEEEEDYDGSDEAAAAAADSDNQRMLEQRRDYEGSLAREERLFAGQYTDVEDEAAAGTMMGKDHDVLRSCCVLVVIVVGQHVDHIHISQLPRPTTQEVQGVRISWSHTVLHST